MPNDDLQRPAPPADATSNTQSDAPSDDTSGLTPRAISERMDAIRPDGGHRGQEGAGGSGKDAELQSVAQSRSDRAAGSSS